MVLFGTVFFVGSGFLLVPVFVGPVCFGPGLLGRFLLGRCLLVVFFVWAGFLLVVCHPNTRVPRPSSPTKKRGKFTIGLVAWRSE